MFPSNNCNNEPVYYNHSDQSGFQRPFPNDITLNSKQDDPSLPFFHLDEHDIFLQQCCDFLLQHQPLRPDIDNMTTTTTTTTTTATATTITSVVNMADFDPTKAQGNATPHLQIPRKRPLKKDRHSKINTARGPRDRRMRLSLEVARPFFNLQDKLGYDKASKTVEWLLIQAEPEIKKLERGLPEMNYSFSGVGAKSASSTSECEVVSEINEVSIRASSIKSRGKPSIKGKKTRQSRKYTLRPLTRDLREKARARARERTSNKKIMRSSSSSNRNNIDNEAKNDNNLNKVCSLSVFENHGEDHSSEAEAPLGKLEELQDLGNHEYAVDDSPVILGKWSPSSIFNYSLNMVIPQEHQFADFQFFGKPYEAWNNQNQY